MLHQRSSSKKCSRVTVNEKSSQSRSPLHNLNAISRSNSTSSNTSTVSSSISVDAPKGCLRFFLSSSNPSSKTPFNDKKLRPLSKTTTKAVANRTTTSSKTSSSSSSSRSKLLSRKENVLPKPTSQKPKKKNPPCLYQWQSGKKSSSKSSSRYSNSEISPELKSDLKNDDLASGSKDFGPNQEHLDQNQQCFKGVVDDDYSGESRSIIKLSDLNNSDNVAENRTPAAKLACGYSMDCPIEDKPVEEDSSTTGATTSTKTPPVQASVSPEIQCGSSTMLVSSATPVCYGAGHVVSGVTDKRKCRARGVLTVGGLHPSRCDESDALGNDNNYGNISPVVRVSRSSLIPLPAEASMQWLLSKFEEIDECNLSDSLSHFQKLVESPWQNLPPSPSPSTEFISNNLNNAKYDGVGESSSGRIRITLLSPRGIPEFQGFPGSPSDKGVARLSSGSPHATPSCNAILSRKNRESSPFSVGSLSSGNVIQTPKSDSSSDRHVGLTWLKGDIDKENMFESRLDSVSEVLHRASVSPSSDISIWDPLGLSFQFEDLTPPTNNIELNRFEKTLNNSVPWVSDPDLENISQSQMRISWREGLVSRIFEMDELDCCRCVSDEENDMDECDTDQLKSHPIENCPFSDNVPRSPEFMEQEPNIIGKGETKLSPKLSNSCAESICTDGGGLVASGDSDWNICYKNQLFEI